MIFVVFSLSPSVYLSISLTHTHFFELFSSFGVHTSLFKCCTIAPFLSRFIHLFIHSHSSIHFFCNFSVWFGLWVNFSLGRNFRRKKAKIVSVVNHALISFTRCLRHSFVCVVCLFGRNREILKAISEGRLDPPIRGQKREIASHTLCDNHNVDRDHACVSLFVRCFFGKILSTFNIHIF